MARSFFGAASGVFAAFALVSGCSSPAPQPMPIAAAPDAGENNPAPSPEGGLSINVDAGAFMPPGFPPCDPTRSVASDGPALLERDPAALAGFSLERVMARLIATAGSSASPLEKLQRLFDTLNTAELGAFADNVHCSDATNEAFENAWPADCPRAEGVLATSAALFLPDSADSFVPVAIVNRFDQAPQNFPTCGEFRIVFAKQSGRTDARNRLLMIFEGVLPNPAHTMAGCVPVADFWASLPALASASERGARLEHFFFEGLPGFSPVIDAKNFGIETFNCRYQDCGRIRLALGMQEPWDFREFRLKRPATTATGSEFYFAPVPLNDTPVPGLFDFYGIDPKLADFRTTLGAWAREVGRVPSVTEMRIEVGAPFVAGDSALAGPASQNFFERVRRSDSASSILSDIDQVLAELAVPCPEGDPLTHESVFQRITALTCAGCHAPERLVSPSRSVGCGLVWPNSLGEAHIDEHGTLSDALVQTLLPQRADAVSTYLQACDYEAILEKFQPGPCSPVSSRALRSPWPTAR